MIEYLYDVAGNRISKTVTPCSGSGQPANTTVYSRDASGNVMAVYEKAGNALIRQTEVHLYGSSRLGMVTEVSEPGVESTIGSQSIYAKLSNFTRHEKLFELNNHLGIACPVEKRGVSHCQ